MNGEEIYNKVKSISNMNERKQYLAKLPEEQKKLYTRYGTSLRQKKFNENPNKKTEYNRIRKDYIADQRLANPDLYKARNIKDVKAFREREKAQKEQIDNKLKSVNTLTDAIRARKARKEMEALRQIKAAAKTEPIKKTKAQQKAETLAKKREYMRRYREEQKGKK
jgi:hypothetical protein